MNIPLESGLLLIRGTSSFFLIGRAMERFALPIETTDAEVFQGVREGDLIVVSAPEGGDVEQARMLLELVRTYHAPLVVLPKDHPGTRRLRMVVSAGPVIRPHSTIVRGTHPEQDVICSSPEFDGVVLRSAGDGVAVEGLVSHAQIISL
ncbi:hypothetical protein AZH53_07680 [Methanomicrobiaceae archaeon CYW5]|uniref:hypothetical protein n=1 Tax=Methanovulcanius yangii TaxID=1789227 RepID=UPI0029CAA9FF|nr:hypothetical protein [Methanovulcanius yangii]MBT8508283.1 hypothetical protein [Methanovulcanius yangii]